MKILGYKLYKGDCFDRKHLIKEYEVGELNQAMIDFHNQSDPDSDNTIILTRVAEVIEEYTILDDDCMDWDPQYDMYVSNLLKEDSDVN